VTSARLAVPLGVDENGNPVWLDLHCDQSHHLLIEGGDSASRSEALRAVAIGAALKTRPAKLQVLGIDVSGRELTVLETLPHAVAETAVDRASARASLLWLATDLEARMCEGRRWPDMLLVIDDLVSLACDDSGRGRAALTRLVRTGGAWGIHVLAGADGLTSGLRSAGWSRADVARLTAVIPQGWYALALGGRVTRLAGVQLSASDLDAVAKGFGPR
jgi:DNA segregation ATPase FtsK/SpoIIIE-like protein